MTYLGLSHYICNKAIHNKLINFAMEGNTPDVNALTIKDYPIFLMVGTGPHIDNGDYTNYRVVFYYINRAVIDDSDTTQIYSNGIEALRNLIKVLKEDDVIMDIENAEYQPFVDTEARVFADHCIGVYTYVNILVPNNGECGIE